MRRRHLKGSGITLQTVKFGSGPGDGPRCTYSCVLGRQLKRGKAPIPLLRPVISRARELSPLCQLLAVALDSSLHDPYSVGPH